jgi:hypothetical protein
MLYLGSYRPLAREKRRDGAVVALVFAATLTVLTAGATVAHFLVKPHGTRVDFPPSDWSTTPPNWVD